MIKEFNQSPYVVTNHVASTMDSTIKYLIAHVPYWGFGQTMLDVGQRSPLTALIEFYFPQMKVDNTEGDLDTFGLPETHEYDLVLYSHTIEHQFNPLHTLLELKKVLRHEGRIFIALPQKPQLLWWSGHYHEIDDYRMRMLLKRAGYEVVTYDRRKEWRSPWFYLSGIRPFLRLFFERHGYYEVKPIYD